MKPSKPINRSLLALAALALSPLAAQASLILNGSFETLNPAFTGPNAYFNNGGTPTVIQNWTQSAPANTLIAQGPWAFVTSVPDGFNFVGFKSGASLSQAFSSPSAGSAKLTFDFWNGNFQFNHVDDLIWSLNGTEVGNSFSNSAKASWVSVSAVVTLLAGDNTLTFRHSNPGNGDVITLDNVAINLTAVPEPGCLLTLGCLIGSGALLRSRRR